jgi:tRNA(Arg) A34 adenosine deaminase TadA
MIKLYMISHNTLLRIALEEARKSDHQHRLGCIIFNKNKILVSGHNSTLKSAKKLHPKFTKWANSIHAEVATILSARTDLNGSSLFIIRINNNEKLLLAKPCQYCRMYLQYVGVKRIIYSVKSGFMEEKL